MIPPLVIAGLVACAAVPLASSLAVLSVTSKVGGYHTTESYLPRAQPLWNDVWNEAVAGLASVSDGLHRGN
ncbi:MAG TPA: hypothetical protein VFL62_23815 [Bradyrhizobium sp.]|uniref:hypothetical protein n=1 Tax=Bradyrhizobium sp. TaxID=376 RepID=UPI002D805099|nr:hypothetical protein [Bradyrhizobium sp.]HET7889269.1 hypothetical protein [Bradyrhizobium sp.]